jgi:F-type H+/Na+-transporting ATPase subunit beta
MKPGRVIAVDGPVVDVQFGQEKEVPGVYEAIKTRSFDGRQIILEVIEHQPGNIARCIALSSTYNLPFQEPAEPLGNFVKIPVGSGVFGRIMNVVGEPIDRKGEILSDQQVPIRKTISQVKLNPEKLVHGERQILETGIKIIDLLTPFLKGSKTGVIGGAALGKSIIILELINNVVRRQEAACVFTGAGERIREGNELYYEFLKQDMIDRVIMVFGQMDEPPGARFEVAQTGITAAEYLQSQNKDVLFFIDSVYRFAQAGSEISTLLGRVPSETGYQPTLASEVSDFHERITTKEGGSITAVESLYVPADDLTDPVVVTTFNYLDSIMVLSRERVQLGLYPAVDPLASSSSNLDPEIVGKQHFEVAQECMRLLTRYEELRKIVSIIGVEELSSEERLLYNRATRLQNFLTQPFFTAEIYTGKKGQYVKIQDTIDGCEQILNGSADMIPEEDLYMIGVFPDA